MKQRWLAEWTDEINRHCNINCINSFIHWGARDDAVVRALTSHQCGPGSNSGFDTYVGLNNFTVVGSFPLLREVHLRVLRFSPLFKNQHFQIPIRPGIRQTKNHFVDVLPPNHYLFYVILFYLYSWKGYKLHLQLLLPFQTVQYQNLWIYDLSPNLYLHGQHCLKNTVHPVGMLVCYLQRTSLQQVHAAGLSVRF